MVSLEELEKVYCEASLDVRPDPYVRLGLKAVLSSLRPHLIDLIYRAEFDDDRFADYHVDKFIKDILGTARDEVSRG